MNELMAAAALHVWFVHLLAAKEANDASTIDSRGTALVTQAQNSESSTRSTGMARNWRLTMNLDKPRSESALVLSHKRVP